MRGFRERDGMRAPGAAGTAGWRPRYRRCRSGRDLVSVIGALVLLVPLLITDGSAGAASPAPSGAGYDRLLAPLASGPSHPAVAATPALAAPSEAVTVVGANESGQFGTGVVDGTPRGRGQFGLPAGETVAAVSAGVYTTTVLTTDGRVWMAGRNWDGELGVGVASATRATAAPVELPAGVVIIAVSSSSHTVALADDGTVWSWGTNTRGELGRGVRSVYDATPAAVPMPDGAEVVAVVAASRSSYALDADGTVYTWGLDVGGPTYDTVAGWRTRPVVLPAWSASPVVELSSRNFHVLARTADGAVWGWGQAVFGELGNGWYSDAPVWPPVRTSLPAGLEVVQLAAGDGFSLARTADGQVYGWGLNGNGQLGIGWITTRQPDPVHAVFPAGVQVAAIAAGSGFALATASADGWWTWGADNLGQGGVPAGVSHDGSRPFHLRASVTGVTGTVDTLAAGESTSVVVTSLDEYVPLPPERLMDTRDPRDAPALEPGETAAMWATGWPGASVAPDAAGVVLNVTATEAQGPGYVTVWSCDAPRPLASNLNLAGGETAANLTFTEISREGLVCFYSQSGTHLVVDLVGWFPAASRYTSHTPVRVLDTRAGSAVQYTGPKPGIGTTVTIPLGPTTPVPDGAIGVVLNVTATEASLPGFVTVWPCGAPRPTASSLNVPIGGTRPNAVITALGTNASVCVFTQAGTHLVADLLGWFPAGSTYRGVQPERLLDTRLGLGWPHGRPGGGQVIELQVTGVGATDVPPGASAAVLNVTGVQAAGGYVTVWPCDEEQPWASSLNLAPGDTRPNLVVTKLSATGTACLFTQQPTDLLVDVTGYWAR